MGEGRYRCTFPAWATVKINGQPWTERSEAMYGNSDGRCPSDKYYIQLGLDTEYYFDDIDGLMSIWKLWKEERENYVKLSREKKSPYYVSDFFYKTDVYEDKITVTWGWIDKTPKFIEMYGVPELKMEISIDITDVKVDLPDFTRIRKSDKL